MKKTSIFFSKSEYEKKPEAIANKYAIRGMTIAIITLIVIWILNILNIFMVDQKTIGRATGLSIVIYLIGIVFFQYSDLTKPWVKYLIQVWSFAIITIITTLLTFHAYIICILPILYSSMYSSKKILRSAYVLTVINIIITVFVGYHYGLCDANMVLLTGEPLAEYLDASNNWTQVAVNDNLLWSLTLFFVVPRSILCYVISMICYNISNIIRNNIVYAQEMTVLAEMDEMTGVYNRNKYLSMTADGYAKEDKIAVIFWDANRLKFTNDTKGHEYGDALLISLAESIRKISDQFDHIYRVGGDEFVMIIRGGDEIIVQKKLEDWESVVKKMDTIQGVPITAAYGFSYGVGKDLEEIIRRADKMMYENKYNFHKENVE